MAEFWTCSGINSWRETAQAYVDYTWEHLTGKLDQAPDRRYASELGTGAHYQGDANVVGLDSEDKLDDEATRYADGEGAHPAVEPGCWRGQTVKAMIMGPKTTTEPPRAPGLELQVYWSPDDQVFNQGIFRMDTLTYWRDFVGRAGDVWPIRNEEGEGLGRGHHFRGYMVAAPRLVKRVLIPRPGSRTRRYVWHETGEIAPDPIGTLRGWLADPANDLVLLGHSQGSNIVMHLIDRGFR